MPIGFISSNKGIQKAFEDVHLHSQLFSSFTVQWQDLEDHLASIKKSIEDRFEALESAEQRSQLIPLCANMDAQGLRSFILAHRKDADWDEVSEALSAAPDPAKLVLDSMQMFYPTQMKNHLVDRLASISPEVTDDLKDTAKKIADNWRATVGKNGENAAECYAFLQFLAVYGLASEFDADELLDRFVVHAARREQTISLCRVLGLTDRIPDLIRKLIRHEKMKIAVDFAYAFDLVDDFHPVPLLEAYINGSKKAAQEAVNRGNGSTESQIEATGLELKALRAVLKCIEEHNLKSKYPPDDIEKRIADLEKQKEEQKHDKELTAELEKRKADSKHHEKAVAKLEKQRKDMKRSAAIMAAMGPLQRPPLNKRPRPVVASALSDRGILASSPLSADQAPQSLAAAAAPYGVAGPGVGSVDLYDSPSVPSLLGVRLGYGVNRSPPSPRLYSTAGLSSGLYSTPQSLAPAAVPYGVAGPGVGSADLYDSPSVPSLLGMPLRYGVNRSPPSPRLYSTAGLSSSLYCTQSFAPAAAPYGMAGPGVGSSDLYDNPSVPNLLRMPLGYGVNRNPSSPRLYSTAGLSSGTPQSLAPTASPYGVAGPGVGSADLYDSPSVPSLLRMPLGYGVNRSPPSPRLYSTAGLSSSLYCKQVGYGSNQVSGGLLQQPSSLQRQQTCYPSSFDS